MHVFGFFLLYFILPLETVLQFWSDKEPIKYYFNYNIINSLF